MRCWPRWSPGRGNWTPDAGWLIPRLVQRKAGYQRCLPRRRSEAGRGCEIRAIAALDLWAVGLCRDGDAGLRRNAHAAPAPPAPPATNLPAAPSQPTAPSQTAAAMPPAAAAAAPAQTPRHAAEWRPDAGSRSREGRAWLGVQRKQIRRRGHYRTGPAVFPVAAGQRLRDPNPHAVNLFKAEHNRYPERLGRVQT